VPFDAIAVTSRYRVLPGMAPRGVAHLMIVGKLSTGAREDMGSDSARLRRRSISAQHGSFTVTSQYRPPPGLLWNDDTCAGDAYGSYAVVQRGRIESSRSPMVTPTRSPPSPRLAGVLR
jgi:hypothetical protein